MCLNSSVLFRTLWILPIIFTSFKRNSLRKDDPLFLGANYICSCYRLIFCPSNKVKCKTLKTTNVQEGMIFNFTCQKLLQTVNLELIWGSYTVDIRLRCPKLDSAIHRISIIHWMVIYPVNSTIQLLNNWSLQKLQIAFNTLLKTLWEWQWEKTLQCFITWTIAVKVIKKKPLYNEINVNNV